MSRACIFLVHGRNETAVSDVEGWFDTLTHPADLVKFEDEAFKGEPIATELERIAKRADAAIVLATPDDKGALAGSARISPRARQNVWLEMGWFWARLGRRRTLLLLQGNIERPSDTDGILFLAYKSSIDEVTHELEDFVTSVTTPALDGVTDVIATDAGTARRSAEYQMVFGSASQRVLVSGIGMANVRSALPVISQELLDGALWSARFLVPNHEFLMEHSQLSTKMYRQDIHRDVMGFCSAVAAEHDKLGTLKDRLSVWSYNGMLTFSATVADMGVMGSLMAVETVLPVSGQHLMARPRLLLRRRAKGGLYDRYARALEYYMDQSRQVL